MRREEAAGGGGNHRPADSGTERSNAQRTSREATTTDFRDGRISVGRSFYDRNDSVAANAERFGRAMASADQVGLGGRRSMLLLTTCSIRGIRGTMNPTSWIWPVALAPIIGSFLGSVVTRVEAPRSIIFGRSRCESCGATLAPQELVPVVSWLASRGRCRRCARPIGLFYPFIELGAVAIAVWAVTVFSGWLLWISCLLGWTLLALAVIDYKHFLLPDFLTLPLIPLGLLVTWANDPSALIHHVVGVAAGFGFVVILREVYRRLRGREGMGLGDAKLFAASGAFVAWQALPSVILIASFTALALALLRTLQGANISLADRMPFGTFLCLATWIIWLYGPLTAG